MKWCSLNSYINEFEYDASKYSKVFEAMCLTFFWTEGSKFRKRVEVTNTDPKMLKMFSVFLLDICNIEPLKIKGRLQIHEGNSVTDAVKFWSELCLIDKKNIIVSIRKRASNPKKNIHVNGIFSVQYNSVGLKKLLDIKVNELKSLSFKV